MDKAAPSSEQLLAVNEALLLGSLHQHELLQVAEDLNQRLLAKSAEQQHTEASLRRSEARYRRLFDSIDEGFCIIEKIDPEPGQPVDFRYIEANPAITRNAGVEDVLGKTMRQVIPLDAQEWIEIYDRVVTSGEPIRFQRTLLGHNRLLDLYALRIEDGSNRQVAIIFSDITERKRTELATARLAAIVQSSFDAIISKDLDGVITSWNPRAQLMFGYTAQEAVGQPITLLFPADRLHEEADILARLKRGQEVERFDTVRLQKGGSALAVSLTISAIKDPQGQVIGASEISRDITARKHAEATLRASEARFRTLFELGPVAVYSCNASGEILDFNPQAATLWGRAPVPGDTDERFCGSYRLFRPDGTFMPHAQCPMAQVIAGEIAEARDGEVLIERPDGSRVTVIVNIRPLKDDCGEIVGAINCFYDISERKRAEGEIKESQERYRVLFGTLPVAAFVCDLDATIQYYNDRAAELWQRQPEVGVARHCGSMKLYLPDGTLLPHEQSPMMEVMRTGISARNVEVSIERPDGSRIPVIVNFAALRDAHGDIVGSVTCFDDISERVRVQSALVEARVIADHASNAKTEFLSRMSHELRTPLGAILGYAQLMEAGTPALVPAQRRSVERILQSGWFLTELIDEILDLAQIESGRLQMSIEPVPLAEVLRECRDMSEPEIQEFGIEVSLPVPDFAYVVQADRVRLCQILINLLSNAIKYNRSGGKVQVQCSAIAPGRLRISVQDSGEGMTADQLAQLFQPFNRIGQEKSTVKGTGIGLVVCKRLVEAMDGVIGVESTPGEGSVVWIEMNLAAPPQPVLERNKSAAAARASSQQVPHANQTGTV